VTATGDFSLETGMCSDMLLSNIVWTVGYLTNCANRHIKESSFKYFLRELG